MSLARVSATTRTLSSAAQPQKVRFLREAEVRRDAKPANSVENDPKRTLDAVLHPFVDLRECEIGHVGWAPHHRQDLGRDIEPRAGSGRRRMALRVAHGTLSFRSRNAAAKQDLLLVRENLEERLLRVRQRVGGFGIAGRRRGGGRGRRRRVVGRLDQRRGVRLTGRRVGTRRMRDVLGWTLGSDLSCALGLTLSWGLRRAAECVDKRLLRIG